MGTALQPAIEEVRGRQVGVDDKVEIGQIDAARRDIRRDQHVLLAGLEGGHGALALVLVGAANVGRISLTFDDLRTNTGTPARSLRLDPPLAVRRGDELGAFNLGSTVVLLAEDARLEPAGPAVGDIVRLGQALWRSTP